MRLRCGHSPAQRCAAIVNIFGRDCRLIFDLCRLSDNPDAYRTLSERAARHMDRVTPGWDNPRSM